MGNWMFFWYWVILDKGPLNGLLLLLCLIWNLAELLEYAKGPTGLYLRLTTMNLTVGGEISHWEWGLDASACTWLQHVHWHRQLWGTGARAPLDSSGLIFLLNFIAAQSLTATCAVASPNIFVFCDSSCDSSVAATRTVFSVLFHVMLCATKKFCVVLSPPLTPDPGDATEHVHCSCVVRQNPVQLRGAVDEGAQVHADQPEVGSCVGLFAVCQQIVCDGAPQCSAWKLCLTVADRCKYRPLFMYNEVLVWLSVCSKSQMISVWSSWCHWHPVISCFIRIQIGLTFLVPTYPGCPGKEAIKWVPVCLLMYNILIRGVAKGL